MQKRLSDYFQLTIKYNDKKTCFIYDPLNKRAFFASSPLPTDTFIVKKCGLQLFYRDAILYCPYPIPSVNSDASIPLLKSNLQKAIRRQHTDIACQSALAIFNQSPVDLMRRLGIIYIEDVCLQDSYSIIVWWMMSDTHYKYTIYDQSVLISIIVSLCNCVTVYEEDSEDNIDSNIDSNIDAVEALHYRHLYGGTKGDMAMIQKAFMYYKAFPEKVVSADYNAIWPNMNYEVEILEESIDFHVYPIMLTILSKKTGIDPSIIKEAIWKTESRLNVRKKQVNDTDSQIWEKIARHITSVRYAVIGYS